VSFDLAQKVADAVLYEGYVLYPYRASAAKNRVRWQFGVVVPRAYAEQGGSEPWAMQTEVLVEPDGATTELDLRVRFLQVQARTIEELTGDGFRTVETLEVDDRTLVTWEEGAEQRIDAAAIPLAELLAGERRIPVEVPGAQETEPIHAEDGRIAGRIVRERRPVSAVVRLAAERTGSLIKVRARIENLVEIETDADRERALHRSLIGAHTLLAVRDGAFVSLLDPPPEAAAEAAACANLHTWPVLIGEAPARDVLLSSPIILYDYPAVAPESAGDFCDATEIDEILTLRVMTLTEDEKREARGTDERARQIIERSDAIPAEIFERMHGAMRSLVPQEAPKKTELEGALADWEAFLNPPGVVAPEEATLEVGGICLAQGSRVILRPSRRADSMDLFLAGRTAVVQGIYRDLEDASYVAVSLEDDPASDMHTWHGRFLYFYPEEVEPLEPEGRPYGETRGVGHSGIGGGRLGDHVAAGPAALSENQQDVSPRTLIAGIGNIFLGDDGFGPEVVRRLASREVPEGTRIVDFGIRGIHLAYELAEKTYDSTILVDATPRGGAPGTVYLIEPDPEDLAGGESANLADAHEMNPRAVFNLLRTLGGKLGRVLVVGCEPSPSGADEMGDFGLSAPVAAAVDEAVALIFDVLRGGRDVSCHPR